MGKNWNLMNKITKKKKEEEEKNPSVKVEISSK